MLFKKGWRLSRWPIISLSPIFDEEAKPESTTTLLNLIRTITAPYANRDCPTVIINGPDMPIRGKSAMSMALLLNEIATNAAKYGALSSPSGQVHVTWSVQQEELFLTWQERGRPAGRSWQLSRAVDSDGPIGRQDFLRLEPGGLDF